MDRGPPMMDMGGPIMMDMGAHSSPIDKIAGVILMDAVPSFMHG